MNYPYYVVQVWEGRLPTPMQYRHTPIERMFTSGKIGGKKMRELPAETVDEAWQIVDRQPSTAQCEVYVIEAPNRYRRRIHRGQR